MAVGNFSDAQVQQFIQANQNNPSAVAAQAAQMGLNQQQIQDAYKSAGVNYTANDINGYAQNNGYTWDNNGALTAAPQGGQAASQPAQQPAAQTGGMQVGNKYYSQAQVQQYLKNGGDPAQIAQANGVTDLGQIHNLTVQADQLAGSGNYLTGDAALQNAFKEYQRYSPNGADAGSYQQWLNNLPTATRSAIQSGVYSGQTGATSQADWAPGGIYGPGSGAYGQQGYASGLGPRGNGSLGGGYGVTGAAAGVTGGQPMVSATQGGGNLQSSAYPTIQSAPPTNQIFGFQQVGPNTMMAGVPGGSGNQAPQQVQNVPLSAMVQPVQANAAASQRPPAGSPQAMANALGNWSALGYKPSWAV